MLPVCFCRYNKKIMTSYFRRHIIWRVKSLYIGWDFMLVRGLYKYK